MTGSRRPRPTTGVPSVVIVGPGRAGGSLATSLVAAGVSIPALATRDGLRHPVADELGLATCTPGDALGLAEVVVLAVPDDAISGLARGLAGRLTRRTEPTGAADQPGRESRPLVAHLSGALGLAPLRPLAVAGLATAAWHVLQAFPSPDTGVRAGVVHAVTTEVPAARASLARLVAALDGRLLDLADADRARYHAAAVIAANGTAGVMVAASRLLEACGLSSSETLAALDPLVDSAREAVVRAGIPGGLTGPWVRGDRGTVERHRAALAGQADVLALYDALARVVGQVALPPSPESSPDA
ncbi:MAG: DUF2520 domain-containing protein [Intrasporangium sp.]|uniref:Rossmann-like and DUF2520 domain-containing protein n=1 Tax=Intrasporangium sp. TaxID=1925024 RepID=UPI002649BAA6|nr:Rossmann-like and DUF2520 domain-containing protein [Intrasporangium sp.]MDN5797710.1 DUF2520 domain-containing protein [Intrasporangium sp.]